MILLELEFMFDWMILQLICQIVIFNYYFYNILKLIN